MSLAQIEAEIPQLTADELRELDRVLQATLQEDSATEPRPDISQWLGSLAGTIKFGPGWDDPLPLEDWELGRLYPAA